MTTRSAFLGVWLLVVWDFGLTARAGGPNYDAFSEPDGAIATEQQEAAATTLVRSPEQLEAVYADAAKGNVRAKHVWQQLEATFTAAGEGVADRATRPGCLTPGYRELSRSCIPDWSFLDFLAKDRPGAVQLRKAIFSAFASRARARGLENRIILSLVNGLVGVGVAAAVLREAEVAGSSAARVEEILKQIDESGAKVKVNPKAPAQEGNVTLDFGEQGRVNVRVETHPLKPGGPPERHANVEVVKDVGGKPVKVRSDHITERQ